MSGQQSNYVSRGGNPTNNKWSLDGVDITDMSATGASAAYYDFDSFQEMTINTGGVDVTQQTGGVGINLVTKSGTDKFRGSSRFFLTDEAVQANNISDDLRAGRDLGQPDPEHQGLRLRDGRADLPRPRVGVGRLRQADRRRRGGGLLQADAGMPGVQDRGGRAGRGLDRGRQRLSQYRPHAPAADQPQGRGAAVQGQPAVDLQQLQQEGAQRARRERPQPDRDHHAAEGRRQELRKCTSGTPGRTRPTSSATSGWSAIACSSTCSTRTSATTSRSACSRRTCAPRSRRSSSAPA